MVGYFWGVRYLLCGWGLVGVTLGSVAQSAVGQQSFSLTTWQSGVDSDSLLEEERPLAERIVELEYAFQEVVATSSDKLRDDGRQPHYTLFGRVYLDTCRLQQDPLNRAQFGDAQGGTMLRSTRLGARGDWGDTLTWAISLEFAGIKTVDEDVVQRTLLTNVYLQWNDLPLLQRLRVGHIREPASLEDLTSSRYETFPERSVLATFIPGRNIGVRATGHSEAEDATWDVGLFREVPSDVMWHVCDASSDALTMRGTWLPWYDEADAGRKLVHLGGYCSFRDIDGGTLRFCRFADTVFSPIIVDTGTMAGVQNWSLLGGEGAVVVGPFSIQSEYAMALVSRAGEADPCFDALYVEVSYFLTGENRVYNRHLGVFNRVAPYQNAFRVRDPSGNVTTGKGAWQIGYRYGYIDLVDAGVEGNRAGVHSIGVNWYLTPYSRLMTQYTYAMCNVIRADEGAPSGNSSLQSLLFRAQFDF